VLFSARRYHLSKAACLPNARCRALERKELSVMCTFEKLNDPGALLALLGSAGR
jgi:hypothetical protein